MKVIVLMYAFVFICLFTANAVTPTPKPPKIQYPPVAAYQVSPKECVKHPLIVKTNSLTARPSVEKAKTVADKVVKVVPINKGANNTIPHFSVLNFINFFYSKDSLDNLHVM